MAAQEPTVSWQSTKLYLAGSLSEERAAPSIETLIAQHYAFIWRVLRGLGLSRADAEDAAQQVFMIAARKLPNVGQERARSFLYGTAVRVASTARRGIRRRRESGAPPDDPIDDAGNGPERAAELREAQALLHELLAEVPEKLRRVLVLSEIEQLEIREIAALERIPVGTATSRLRLARERLRTLLAAARHRNPFASES
jgi:RNA polymerase sigma-70 factor (ECF subfamily)